MRSFTHTVLALGTTVALAACGVADANMAGAVSNIANLSEEGKVALSQVLVVTRGTDKTSNRLDCQATRASILTKRTKLRAGNDWSNVTNTEPYKAMQKKLDAYDGAGCSPENDAEGCKGMREEIGSAADMLAKTAEWGVLMKNKEFEDVSQAFERALSTGCVAPATL